MKKRIQAYIKTWESRCYFDGIPDEVDSRLEILNKAPSYKAIAICILKNDVNLIGLGFQPPKSKVYHELKRMELIEKGLISRQLKLF